ncbi:MAG: hypothetical protein HRU19_09890 [Pseudobacteriovorax sp.]|nr:hypothetical protein [Pseudobacteriovorax sp.]
MKPLSGILATACLMATTGLSAADCPSEINYWPYETTTGNDEISALFFADLHLERNCNLLRGEVHAGAVADFRGISIEAVDAIAEVALKDRRTFSVETIVTVVGMVVQEFKYEEIAEIGYSDSFDFPISMSQEEIVMVGPVPVSVEYGIVGEAGLNYDATLQIGALDVGANPYVDTSVFANGGIDVGFASVKASGEMTMVNDSFDARLNLAIDQVNFDKLVFTANATNEFEALDGRISVFAEASVAGFSREYETDLFNWDGYSRTDNAFDIEVDVPLNL